MPVEFASRDSWRFPASKDISLGGMLIDTTSPAAFGAAVFVGYTLPGHREPMLVLGTVRWTTKSGMGVQFGPLAARETHTRHHGDPTRAGRTGPRATRRKSCVARGHMLRENVRAFQIPSDLELVLEREGGSLRPPVRVRVRARSILPLLLLGVVGCSDMKRPVKFARTFFRSASSVRGGMRASSQQSSEPGRSSRRARLVPFRGDETPSDPRVIATLVRKMGRKVGPWRTA
jgi:hypothetical protein